MIMDFDLKNDKRHIEIGMFGRKFVFGVDETSVTVCENIRSEAKDMLDNLECFDDKNVLETVAEFLKASLERLVGDEILKELERCCDMSVPELTGILCYVISEIGLAFSDNGSGNDE